MGFSAQGTHDTLSFGCLNSEKLSTDNDRTQYLPTFRIFLGTRNRKVSSIGEFAQT